MVKGIDRSFVKILDIKGVGYRAGLKAANTRRQHQLYQSVVMIPEGSSRLPTNVEIVIRGIDKQASANSPQHGIVRTLSKARHRYRNEHVRRKEGKLPRNRARGEYSCLNP